MVKRWYQSKIVILNLLVAIFASLEASTGILKPVLPEEWFTVVAVTLPILNIILRFVTTQPVK